MRRAGMREVLVAYLLQHRTVALLSWAGTVRSANHMKYVCRKRTATVEGGDMGSHGIKDRVAIVGMGCTPFAEHWDKGVPELLLDATSAAFASAGGTTDD